MMGFVYKICGEAYPVHRLDENTSGLMLVALTGWSAKTQGPTGGSYCIEALLGAISGAG